MRQLMPEIQTLGWLKEWPRYLHLPVAPMWHPSIKCPICTWKDDQRGKKATAFAAGRHSHYLLWDWPQKSKSWKQKNTAADWLLMRRVLKKKERETGCQMQNPSCWWWSQDAEEKKFPMQTLLVHNKIMNQEFSDAIRMSSSLRKIRECHRRNSSWRSQWHAKGLHWGGEFWGRDGRGAFNEKHSTTETTCLFAPTTTATTQKHTLSRFKAKYRANKKKFISTQNKANRNERERERERENLVGETNWFGTHQVHAQESLHSDWKTVAPRRWRYPPYSLITRLLQAASIP